MPEIIFKQNWKEFKDQVEKYFSGNPLCEDQSEIENTDCTPLCTVYCHSRDHKDGFCQSQCNSEECQYDGGDCVYNIYINI